MLKKNAMDYFYENDPILHITMSECINRGMANIIYADTDGVLLRYSNDDAYMFTAIDELSGKRILEQIEKCNVICHTIEALVPYIKEKYVLKGVEPCYVSANMSAELMQLDDSIDIHPLNEANLSIVCQHYHGDDPENKKYIQQRIASGNMFGAFDTYGNMMGFIGMHTEGACGMLEVFPEFRRKGIGSALERYISNHLIAQGFIPFGHIITDNYKSLALQRSLGMQISSAAIYWQF
ncbi:MAG: GNAT family N-acetyltransferase [Clostridia bacterium]|nr:GNAT family N-acetyltransferase [Clostridia bacterium]